MANYEKEHEVNPLCGCPITGHSYATLKVIVSHRSGCPHHRFAQGAQQNETDGAEAAMAPEGPRVASMDLARFKRAEKPAGLSPRGALEAAMEWIDDPETDAPTHIIVLVGRDAPDGGSMTRYFQAGAYRHHAQMGLCLEAMHMIRESGS